MRLTGPELCCSFLCVWAVLIDEDLTKLYAPMRRKVTVFSVFLLKTRTTIRHCLGSWITAFWLLMPSGCFSGLYLLFLADLVVFLSERACAALTNNHLSCSQWDIWWASPSAVLPEYWDVDEWVVHMSVWPRLLLEHPLTGVLRLRPGKETNPQTFNLLSDSCILFSFIISVVGHLTVISFINKSWNVSSSATH